MVHSYKERASHQKYLAKKCRYHFADPKYIELNPKQGVWRIAGIRQGVACRFYDCLSLNGEEIKTATVLQANSLSDQLVIGDLIQFEGLAICGILNRRNLLSRQHGDHSRYSLHVRKIQPIAANLDAIVIVASAKNPDFQPGFIDRYMILAQQSNISPIICITKSDLVQISDPILDWYHRELHSSVIHLSIVTGEGINDLKNLILGKTVVLVGKSGVGKSALTNFLLNHEVVKTGMVSAKSGQGKHTTTAAKLYLWDKDSYIIDTPGIRALEFFEIAPDDLRSYFPEFTEYATKCQYRDCRHYLETDCAVKKAVQAGTIASLRYHTYRRLLEEGLK